MREEVRRVGMAKKEIVAVPPEGREEGVSGLEIERGAKEIDKYQKGFRNR